MSRWAALTSRVRVSTRSRPSPPLYPHFNRPSGFWPCVKSCLVGGSDKYWIKTTSVSEIPLRFVENCSHLVSSDNQQSTLVRRCHNHNHQIVLRAYIPLTHAHILSLSLSLFSHLSFIHTHIHIHTHTHTHHPYLSVITLGRSFTWHAEFAESW